MGTNYDLHFNPCPTCGHSIEKLHIGKSSKGWCFALHVGNFLINEEIHAIGTLDDWKRIFEFPNTTIKDEYGKKLTTDEMLRVITIRSNLPNNWTSIPPGYTSWGEFHRRNKSQLGPNGLLRSQIGDHCIGHGDGTWDLITGEFS